LEECDDGNAISGDGCHNGEIETGWTCIVKNNTEMLSSCETVCGDNCIFGKEQCDSENGIFLDLELTAKRGMYNKLCFETWILY